MRRHLPLAALSLVAACAGRRLRPALAVPFARRRSLRDGRRAGRQRAPSHRRRASPWPRRRAAHGGRLQRLPVPLLRSRPPRRQRPPRALPRWCAWSGATSRCSVTRWRTRPPRGLDGGAGPVATGPSGATATCSSPHQSELSRESLLRDARAVGVDATRSKTALDEGTWRAAVDGDAALAERLAIDGTPAFVLNGSPVVGLQPFAVFESAARLILARAEAMPDPSRVYADMVRHPVALPEPASEGRATVDPWAGVHELPSLRRRPPEAGRAPRWCPGLQRLRVPLLRPGAPDPRRAPSPLRRPATASSGGATCAAPPRPRAPGRRGGARGARAARPGGLLGDAQPALRPAVSRGGAEPLGDPSNSPSRRAPTRARLRAALEDHRHRAVIDADVAAAAATRLRLGTPAFFINGHFMSGRGRSRSFVSASTGCWSASDDVPPRGPLALAAARRLGLSGEGPIAGCAARVVHRGGRSSRTAPAGGVPRAERHGAGLRPRRGRSRGGDLDLR